MNTTVTLDPGGPDPIDVDVTMYGQGRPVLLLHGGAGPISVIGFAERLAAGGDIEVVVPVHPGFEGTARPGGLGTIRGLAAVYVALLDALDLKDVTVVGNSIGGWIAAEIALLASPRVARTVLVDAVGLDLPEAPIADFFSLTMAQVADLSYADPDRFRIDPAALPPDRQAAMAVNRDALRVYRGTAMTDPTLLDRLPNAVGPVLVVWGAADRMVPAEHGLAYADALPGSSYRVIGDAGHLPQLETPDALLALIVDFMAVTEAARG